MAKGIGEGTLRFNDRKANLAVISLRMVNHVPRAADIVSLNGNPYIVDEVMFSYREVEDDESQDEFDYVFLTGIVVAVRAAGK